MKKLFAYIEAIWLTIKDTSNNDSYISVLEKNNEFLLLIK